MVKPGGRCMQLFAALLACVMVVAGQGQEFSQAPLKDPFSSFNNASSVDEIQISGKQLAAMKTGDYVHPTFSPDGKVLAYSKVIVKKDFENTEVLLYSLSTRRTSVLLNPQRARKYGTYKAYVSEMDWKSPRRLEVVIGDGDVGTSYLTFDPFRRRLLREKHESSDDFEVPPLSPLHRQARQQAVTLFPDFPRNVLDGALSSDSALVLPGRGIVLQKNYAGHDSDVWFLDFQGRSVKHLLDLPDDAINAFRGGLSFESSIIIALAHGSKTYLFLYRDGKVKPLREIKSPGNSWIEIKHRSSEGVVFLVRTHGTAEKGDNPLFIFNGDRLLQVKEYPELYDAAIDASGQRIAYCYWEGERRHIVIKELN